MKHIVNSLFYIFLFFLISECSFDKKNRLGVWTGVNEKKRVAELEIEQGKELINIYTTKKQNLPEIKSNKIIKISKPKNNLSWQTSNLNLQNYTGNIYLSGIDYVFLKKKIGKNKFNLSRLISSPIIFEDNIIFSDDVGTIFNVNKRGKVMWKKNIYKKVYKKIYKTLNFSIYNSIIYVSDNIGFVYSIELNTGKIFWIKNQGVALKSELKVFDDKIFLINQDNRIICLEINGGTKLWDIRLVTSFIKMQNFLPLAISKNGALIALTSSGDLMKINANTGSISWSLNTTPSSFAHDTDFFNSSSIVITDSEVIFFAFNTIFSFNLDNGRNNWREKISSTNTPVVDGENIFFVSDDGFFVNLNRNSGKIIRSNNILKILKSRKQETKITGFVMGSGKIYATSRNGFLITCSPATGKVEDFKKIGDKINSSPIISDGSLFILTEKSKIFGFTSKI